MRNTSMLFYGQDNLLDYVLEKAAEILNTTEEKLSVHPDFLYIEREKDKSSIGVDSANEIVSKSYLAPSFGDYQVCVINHMEAMTKEAQNKLLKTLEESSMIILGVCYEDEILPTVKSRMRRVCISEKKKIPENVKAVIDKALIAINNNPVKLFDCLNLIKEKDKNSFYQIHRDYIGYLISFIGNACSSRLSKETIERLGYYRVHCMSSVFTQNDFFVMIATVVNELLKGGDVNVAV